MVKARAHGRTAYTSVLSIKIDMSINVPKIVEHYQLFGESQHDQLVGVRGFSCVSSFGIPILLESFLGKLE